MELRVRETGQVMMESEFRAAHPNTSFPQLLDQNTLNSFGVDVVFEGPQPSPTRYQTAYRNGVTELGGKWYTNWTVVDVDDEAKARIDEAQANAVRATRNQKLKDSDWTQVSDAPVDKEAWTAYRQSLRDLTNQTGFPWDITWPVEPT